MFTRSAITPPEVNGFGSNLGNSEYIVWSWPWQILGAIRAEARAGKFCCFCQVNNTRLRWFPVSQISRNLHTRRGSVTWWILSDFFGENLPLRGLFQKTLIIVNDFRLQAAIYRKWLQILESDDRLARLWNVGFHPYRWNQLKFIRLASRLRTRKDFPGHRRLFRLVLRT